MVLMRGEGFPAGAHNLGIAGSSPAPATKRRKCKGKEVAPMADIEGKKVSWFLKMAYSSFLRGLLKAAIDDPDDDWDNVVLDTLDGIFGYEEAA